MNRVFVGIDWGATVHSVCALDEGGERIWAGEVTHTGEGINALVERALGWVDGDASKLLAAMEAPRGSIIEALMERGANVYSINPKQVDRFRDRYSIGGAKDDDFDAYVMADTLRTDLKLYRRVKLAEPQLLRFRELSRSYTAVTADVLALANQVREHLQRYYPEMVELGRWHEEPWLWALFDLAPSPERVPALTTSKIKHVLKTHGIRRYRAIDVFERLNVTALPVAPGVAEAVRERVGSLLPRLRVAHEQRSICSQQLEKLFAEQSAPASDDSPEDTHRDAAIVLSFPGVGIHNGATMLAEAHEALQQRDYQALRRRAGAAPVSKRTGGKRNTPQVVQRRACNNALRNAIHQWTRVATQHEPKAKAHYATLRKRGHNHARALRGVGDRLCLALIGALKSGTLYDPQRRSVTTDNGL
jgi:hypothetical protein